MLWCGCTRNGQCPSTRCRVVMITGREDCKSRFDFWRVAKEYGFANDGTLCELVHPHIHGLVDYPFSQPFHALSLFISAQSISITLACPASYDAGIYAESIVFDIVLLKSSSKRRKHPLVVASCSVEFCNGECIYGWL